MAAVSSRYARAFADVVMESKLDAKKVVGQVRDFVAIFESNEDLRKVWESPAVPPEQKRALLDKIAAQMGAIERPLRNFMAVLIDHSRIVMLPEIARQFETELNARMGLVEAVVTSARELSDGERLAIVAQVSKATGRQVAAKYEIDPALLGGAKVRVGSTVYDGSVRGQLQKIKQELAGE